MSRKKKKKKLNSLIIILKVLIRLIKNFNAIKSESTFSNSQKRPYINADEKSTRYEIRMMIKKKKMTSWQITRNDEFMDLYTYTWPLSHSRIVPWALSLSLFPQTLEESISFCSGRNIFHLILLTFRKLSTFAKKKRKKKREKVFMLLLNWKLIKFCSCQLGLLKDFIFLLLFISLITYEIWITHSKKIS